MSKDKKNEGKEILEEFKELSEWQKRNQEYLKKKAEEEVALAEEKEKERQARMASKSEKSDATEDQESESDPKDPKSAKEDAEEKVEESEDVKKEVVKEESKSKKTEKEDKRDKNAEKKPVKEKPVKPKIPGVHIWRAISILFLSLILLVVSAYLLSPYATMKDIRVEGTVQTTADDIRQASGIQDSDYTINLLLDKEKYEEQIKSNYWVESAQLVYQFPTKFTIKVKEYDIVAYYVSGENHYPILSSGQLETSSVSLVSLPETYISVLFNDSEQIKTFTSELAQISPELKAAIQKVELAPSKVTSDLIRLTMNDSDEVLVPLSEMSKKLPYYSKIKPQLSEPSVIDMEAGIYSYTVADKLIMEAEEKAKQEAKEAEKKQKEEEKKRLEEQQNKLEEEKKKLEEESNRNQTSQRSSRR
ncbi:cell division protein DivIB [Streptococcus sp. NM]|uniref:cell division protein FtsQ/DivIB n=1 Tax=Streptococcus sp. NM TaxID=2292266 RepID=UPI000E238792|nr:cell division protein FtsQ/DivIB [Streptococcus sp. NM]REK92527.1 cell division protein DivIB [Streptococcus sp. NM]